MQTQPMSSNFFSLRPYKPEDKSFIMASFLRGIYYGNPFYHMAPKDSFMQSYKQVGEALIENGNIVVACLKDDIDIILGYAILSKDNNTLHWCFVKTAWRKQGIMTAIMPQSVKTYTHFTELGLVLKNKINAIFDPFKL